MVIVIGHEDDDDTLLSANSQCVFVAKDLGRGYQHDDNNCTSMMIVVTMMRMIGGG